ncbi:MAG: methyltransferase domain-containing protein [Patescibacteria group bacterium]
MFADPENNVEQLIVGEGRVVADMGAGSGAYTMALARAVGRGGRVYAVDVQKQLLDKIAGAAREARLSNVEVIWGDIERPEGTKLRRDSVDLALISNALFQVHDKGAAAREAFRIVVPGGRACIIDWTDSFGGLGPHPRDVIGEDDAREIFERAGFIYERSISAGAHHYGIILRKPEQKDRSTRLGA